MITSRQQNIVQNQNVVIENLLCENVEVQISGSNGNKYERHPLRN